MLNFAVAAVVAAPSLANITSFLWATLAWGRDKIRFIVGLQLATAICVCTVGFASENRVGLFLLVALVIASRIAWTGVITLRTTVWANNYPRADRTKIAGRLATVQAIVFAFVGVGIGKAMDWNERSFHLLFPLSAIGRTHRRVDLQQGCACAASDGSRDRARRRRASQPVHESDFGACACSLTMRATGAS